MTIRELIVELEKVEAGLGPGRAGTVLAPRRLIGCRRSTEWAAPEIDVTDMAVTIYGVEPEGAGPLETRRGPR